MAISGGDGSIILTTKVDTSGVNKGMTSIKSIVGKVGGVMAAAFSVRALINFGKEAINLASDLQEVQNVVDTAFGSMSYKIEQFSKTAIEKFGISELTAKRTASTYMAMAKGMGIVDDVASDMAITMTGLTADIASFYNMSQERADVILKSVYTGETETLKQLGIVMTEVNLENFAMSKGITKSLSAMTQQEKTMLRYQFVLQQTALAQGDFAKTSDSWANQTRILAERWKEMQSIFGQAFVALGTLVLPAINAVVSGMTKLANITSVAAQNIYKMFTGKTLEFGKTENTVSNLGGASADAATGMADLGDATEKAGKQAKKSLAGFDDLQIIASNISDSAGSAGGSAGGITETGEGADYMAEAEKINTALTYIMGIVGGALVAVGLLLLFNGNIPWGVGFIVAGATIFGVSAAALGGDNPSKNATKALATLMGVIGGALVALGIMLIYLGSVAWGVGFIIAGAASLGVGAKAIKDFDTNKVENVIMMIEGIAAGALLALGIILLVFNGANPLSIGLIVAGAGLLAITVAQIMAGQVESDVAKTIHTITTIASAAFLALGIILVVAGVSLPLGIGLIVAGAAGLAAEVAINWDYVVNIMRGKVGTITTIVSGALLVLGAILLFTGVGTGLGLGLILAGAAGLATVVAFNWNFLTEKVQECWKNIKQFWNENIAPIFTAEWWYDLGKKALNGLITVFEAALNNITSGFRNLANTASSLINAIGGALGLDWNIPQIPKIKLPRLAQGAVIPPNKEFLAVLGDQKHGTNIEAPLQTIVDAFNIALQGNANYGGGNTEVILEIDGREFGRAVVEQGNRENRRIGTKLVIA